MEKKKKRKSSHLKVISENITEFSKLRNVKIPGKMITERFDKLKKTKLNTRRSSILNKPSKIKIRGRI